MAIDSSQMLNPAQTWETFSRIWTGSEIAWILVSFIIVIGLNVLANNKVKNSFARIAIRGGTLLVGFWFVFFLFIHKKIAVASVNAYAALAMSCVTIVYAFVFLSKKKDKNWAQILFWILFALILFTALFFLAKENIPIGLAYFIGLIMGWILSSFINAVKEVCQGTSPSDQKSYDAKNKEWKPRDVDW